MQSHILKQRTKQHKNRIIAEHRLIKLREIEVKLDDTNLQKVSSTKFLGVIIDENLTWKSHRWNFKNYYTKCWFSRKVIMLYS